MRIGIDTFVLNPFDPDMRGPGTEARRVADLMEEAEHADRVGL
jgi:hypothetical protein